MVRKTKTQNDTVKWKVSGAWIMQGPNIVGDAVAQWLQWLSKSWTTGVRFLAGRGFSLLSATASGPGLGLSRAPILGTQALIPWGYNAARALNLILTSIRCREEKHVELSPTPQNYFMAWHSITGFFWFRWHDKKCNTVFIDPSDWRYIRF
jgi:hypothetical protein